MKITVGKNTIGNDERTFVVAEAACNHMCDMALARKMIDKAVEAGADAIKFQTYKAEKLVTSDAVAFWGNETISQVEYYRRLDRFGKREYEQLFSYANEKGIVCFSSPFDMESADMLNDLDMPLIKIASCEMSNLEFIAHCAGFGKPIILSTGASEPEEISRALKTIHDKGNDRIILLACTLSYPTQYADANLNRIRTLRAMYPDMIIGLSDHTEPDANMVLPALGVALGARMIEKHYTLDRSMTGSGHFFAVDPSSLKRMVDNIRLAEAAFGLGHLGVDESERKAWGSARRSIVAEVAIRKGEMLTRDKLGVKRPADGLPATRMADVVGKRANRDIARDQKVSFDMLEDR